MAEEWSAEGRHIALVRGDITLEAADAVVNAANPYLLPGGGVSGAIHRAGGPAIAAECRVIVEARGPLPVGDAAITTAGALPARFVIHAVGPVWTGDDAASGALASAYGTSVSLADERGLESIAFPSISTGIFSYPVDRAAPVALRAVRDALLRAGSVRDARFVLFDEATFAAYADALGALGADSRD